MDGWDGRNDRRTFNSSRSPRNKGLEPDLKRFDQRQVSTPFRRTCSSRHLGIRSTLLPCVPPRRHWFLPVRGSVTPTATSRNGLCCFPPRMRSPSHCSCVIRLSNPSIVIPFSSQRSIASLFAHFANNLHFSLDTSPSISTGRVGLRGEWALGTIALLVG